MTERQAYQVLARKYRPQSFVDLIGQDVLVKTVTNAITHNRIASGFLLTGIRGIGKTTTARIIARVLNCIGEDGKGDPTPSPCGVCEHCVSIREDRHPDVLEMDAASRTGVDDIREIIEQSRYLPTSARYKIFIIDEVHMLSKNAFNALLKTLEEPPAHVKFIFATTETRKIPITIISRCQRFDLRRIDRDQLAVHLKNIVGKESANAEDEALQLIAEAAEGSVRDALSLLDQAIAMTDGNVTTESTRGMMGLADHSLVVALYESLSKGDAQAALQQFQDIHHIGGDPVMILQDLLGFVHAVTKTKVLKGATSDISISQHEQEKMETLAQALPMSFLTSCWQMLLKGIAETRQASNGYAAAEMILIRLCHMATLPSPAKLAGVPQESNQTAPQSASSSPVERALEQIQATAEPKHAANANKMIAEIASFPEMVELFRQKKELLLSGQLFSNVGLIAFKPPLLELCPEKDMNLGTGFTQDIQSRLREWTGTPWEVRLSNDQASPSLETQERQAQQHLEDSIAGSADVKRVLEVFPDATITKIAKVS